jgi:hypothetical protein
MARSGKLASKMNFLLCNIASRLSQIFGDSRRDHARQHHRRDDRLFISGVWEAQSF